MLNLLIAAALTFAAPDEAPKSLTPAEAEQLQQNLDRGNDLYHYDQSAWHVTDAAVAALSEDSTRLIRGYVTTPAPSGLRTTFFGEADGSYYALYSAVWTGSSIEDPKVFSPEARAPVTEEEHRLILARKVALDSQRAFDMCSSARPNVIVVPGADSIVHVYVLTPQTKNGVYPMGGHHRVDVKDGKVVATRSFTNSCIDLEKGDSVGLIVTHLRDPVPTEIHAFGVLTISLPIYVGVRDGRMYVMEVVDGRPRASLIAKQ